MKILIGNKELIASYRTIQSAGYNAAILNTEVLGVAIPT